MWSISEVKARGKAAFKDNYWTSVLVAIIMGVCTGGLTAGTSSKVSGDEDIKTTLMNTLQNMKPEEIIALAAIITGTVVTISGISLLIQLFLTNPILVGSKWFFKDNAEGAMPTVSSVTAPFTQDYGRTILTMFLTKLFQTLWGLLFLIPGIIKGYSYRMVPYILADNPDLSATEVITASRQMMNGNKLQTFLMDLSFIGWIILTIFTCGLAGVFYVSPYMASTDAVLYETLKGNGTQVY